MTLRPPLAVMPSWGMSLLPVESEFYFISLPRRGFCFTGVKLITPESLHILPLFRNPPWILKCLLSPRSELEEAEATVYLFCCVLRERVNQAT